MKTFTQCYNNGEGGSIVASFDGRTFTVTAIVGKKFQRWEGTDQDKGRKLWWEWGDEIGLRPMNEDSGQ